MLRTSQKITMNCRAFIIVFAQHGFNDHGLFLSKSGNVAPMFGESIDYE